MRCLRASVVDAATPLFAGDAWIWWLTALFVASVFGVYVAAFRRRSHSDGKRLEEAASLGFDRPTGQYPYIDPRLCIGCGSCVAACPEGDVLGLVGGQAVVVNGVRCVGISACETACPVGAIEVGLGEVRGRADLPILESTLETNVPGLFVAGELGGLSLVRNAVGQGRQAARAIARRLEEERHVGPAPERQLLIVGSGPAGLSAALTATQLGLDALVLEQEADLGGTILNYPRRKLVHTQPVEVPLHGRLDGPEHSKEELLELFGGLVERHELQIAFGARVRSVEGEAATGFTVRTDDRAFTARCVLLALGRRGSPRRLGVPGESLPKVMYQVRDAEEYRGSRILCVGGGDSAVEAAMGLASQPGNEVLLSYRKDRFARIKHRNRLRLDDHLARGSVRAVFESNVKEIRPEAVCLRTPSGDEWLPNDYVFIFAGGEPPYSLLRSAGVRFGDDL